MQKLGVIGYPISHSLSPVIHNYWLHEHNINAQYEAIAVQPEALEDFVRSMPENGFIGVNVTIPHKEAVFRIIQEIGTIHGFAGQIGAVNTILIDQNGKIQGKNTDDYGFLKNLAAIDLGKQNVLLLGAGGAARAVCLALRQPALSIRIANRTREKAEKLADALNNDAQNETYRSDKVPARITVIDWDAIEEAMATTSLLVNTTSLGMKGQPPLAISLKNLPTEAIINDIVYNPLETDLLKQARAQGNTIVDGLGMLLYQAQMAFSQWFPNVTPEVTPELRRLVLKHIK